MQDVAGPGRKIFRPNMVPSGDLPKQMKQLVDGNAFTVCDVDSLTKTPTGFRSEHICIHRVTYVCEIAALFAVSIDHRTLPFQQSINKLRNHPRVGRTWILPGSKNIEVAQAQSLQPITAVKDLAIVLSDQFRRCIRR